LSYSDQWHLDFICKDIIYLLQIRIILKCVFVFVLFNLMVMLK